MMKYAAEFLAAYFKHLSNSKPLPPSQQPTQVSDPLSHSHKCALRTSISQNALPVPVPWRKRTIDERLGCYHPTNANKCVSSFYFSFHFLISNVPFCSSPHFLVLNASFYSLLYFFVSNFHSLAYITSLSNTFYFSLSFLVSNIGLVHVRLPTKHSGNHRLP